MDPVVEGDHVGEYDPEFTVVIVCVIVRTKLVVDDRVFCAVGVIWPEDVFVVEGLPVMVGDADVVLV